MIMKKYFIFATALAALASCSSDDFVGESPNGVNGQIDGAISFNMGTTAVTRADKTGAGAAEDLNNTFYVWGIKNEGGTTGNGISAASTGNLVYNNYVVKWTDNSAMTSTSNTEGWEYVGYTLSEKEIACITPNGSTSTATPQTIKYWDYGAYDYTFYAFSANPDDLATTDPNVTVEKTLEVTSPSTVYDKGYTVTLSADANLDKLFFSERVNILASANTERTSDNTYGGNVTFRFHNGSSKVRVAMYETIPGYSVTINQFLVDNDGTDPEFDDMENAVTANFAANLQNSKKGDAGTLTVTYNSEEDATQNWPILSFTPTSGKNKVLNLGTQLAANVKLGTTAATATYDTADGSDADSEPDYTSVFPNEANTQNLKLKVNYTLTATNAAENAPTTGETIKIEGATAEIPAAYLKWKPGFAYTYIFKISDNTNGSSGQGVVGLYPITFDAVEVVAEDGQAEYITTVSEPSITTFGAIYNTTSNKYTAYQTGKNGYQVQTSPNLLDIFATIMDGSSVITPNLGTNVNIYKGISSSDAAFPVTEASLAEAIAETGGSAGEKITYTQDNTIATVCTGANVANGIPGEDGNTITGVPAIKLANLAAGTYAIEYIHTPDAFTTDGGKTYVDAAAFNAAGTLYTTAECTVEATTWTDGTTYFKKIANKPGTKVYKVINVVAAGSGGGGARLAK